MVKLLSARNILFPTRIRVLSYGFRVLLGVIGAAALSAGLAVAATELRYAFQGSPLVPTALVAVVACVVAVGGFLLIRGAIRGRIAVRSARSER
jgi:hypothetical protein